MNTTANGAAAAANVSRDEPSSSPSSSPSTSSAVAPQQQQSTRFDPTFTRRVVENMGPKTSPRNRQILGSLIRHLHDFAREVELTPEEWMTGVHYINSVGQISTKTRNEAHRVSDVLGLESYVILPFTYTDFQRIQPTSASCLVVHILIFHLIACISQIF